MSVLPRPRPDGDAEPPLVVLARDRLRRGRAGRLVKRHRSLAAAVAGLLVVLRTWRWLLVDVVRDDGTRSWVLGHWVLVLGASGALFLVVAAAARLGIDRVLTDREPFDGSERLPDHGDRALQHARDAALLRR